MPDLETFRLSKDRQLDEPYITAGDRAYLIGAQNGRFPDMGWHVEGEMGGVWAHPIKLLDGFWLSVDGEWLGEASGFAVGASWSEQGYRGTDGLHIVRRQFAPDGMAAIVVRYTFQAPRPRTLRLRLLARTDLRGVWLSEVGGQDEATYLADLGSWLCRDAENPWSVVVGSRDRAPTAWECGLDLWGPERTRGQGISVALEYEIAVDGETSFEIVTAGDATGPDAACATFEAVRRSVDDLERQKDTRYRAMLGFSDLTTADVRIDRAWDWVKCNNDWLVRDVPGIGRGLGAGAADYVWWFGCDSCYAVYGCLALGQHEMAKDTLDLLRERSIAVNGDIGRVLHECTTAGAVFNPGCTQETPHFVRAVWETTRWTGDRAFLDRNYEFCRRGLLDWTLGAMCPPGDRLPRGYGIMEIEGFDLRCLDVATHTALALDALSEMAEIVGDAETVVRCRELEPRIRATLEEHFWMEGEGLYGDIVATPNEMLPRLRSWRDEAEQAGKERAVGELVRLIREAEDALEPDRLRPWYLGNWTTLAPIETGLAAPERAVRALTRIEQEFANRWGVYVNAFHEGPAMSINTGALAVAEVTYGRMDEGIGYLHLLTETLEMHMPGAISEISPDDGCFVQAWSGYGLAWPVVTQLFGLRPDAICRHLEARPRFPRHWQGARLENVRIGDTTCDLSWDGERLQVTVGDPSWTVCGGEGCARLPTS